MLLLNACDKLKIKLPSVRFKNIGICTEGNLNYVLSDFYKAFDQILVTTIW